VRGLIGASWLFVRVRRGTAGTRLIWRRSRAAPLCMAACCWRCRPRPLLTPGVPLGGPSGLATFGMLIWLSFGRSAAPARLLLCRPSEAKLALSLPDHHGSGAADPWTSQLLRPLAPWCCSSPRLLGLSSLSGRSLLLACLGVRGSRGVCSNRCVPPRTLGSCQPPSGPFSHPPSRSSLIGLAVSGSARGPATDRGNSPWPTGLPCWPRWSRCRSSCSSSSSALAVGQIGGGFRPGSNTAAARYRCPQIVINIQFSVRWEGSRYKDGDRYDRVSRDRRKCGRRRVGLVSS